MVFLQVRSSGRCLSRTSTESLRSVLQKEPLDRHDLCCFAPLVKAWLLDRMVRADDPSFLASSQHLIHWARWWEATSDQTTTTKASTRNFLTRALVSRCYRATSGLCETHTVTQLQLTTLHLCETAPGGSSCAIGLFGRHCFHRIKLADSS